VAFSLQISLCQFAVKEDLTMQKFYRILWSIVILLIIITTVIFFFGFFIVAAAVVSLLGLYRYYFTKGRSRVFKTKPYTTGEVIDLKAEEIHETNEAKKPNEF